MSDKNNSRAHKIERKEWRELTISCADDNSISLRISHSVQFVPTISPFGHRISGILIQQFMHKSYTSNHLTNERIRSQEFVSKSPFILLLYHKRNVFSPKEQKLMEKKEIVVN